MRKTKENQKGITLVALVITIIVLLILAGISISALTNTGIFQKAQEAKKKSAEAEANQKATLDEYETELNKYTSLADMFDETGEVEGKIHVGDYVEYIPDTASTDGILDELETYSGSSSNTAETLKQEMELKWRVLDVEDGQVRLISATPTTSTIALQGAKGYNNAVYLLDKACKTLYNNSKLASNVQNIKIEDIQDSLIYDYTQYTNSYGIKYGKTIKNSDNKNYPNLFTREKNGTIDGIQGRELELSEQTQPINEESTTANESIEITQTYWEKTMSKNDFKKTKYYELFLDYGNSNSTIYWIASRVVNVPSNYADFSISVVMQKIIYLTSLYNSTGSGYPSEYAFRPIITLKSNVKIDENNTGNGSTPEKAYTIKLAE